MSSTDARQLFVDQFGFEPEFVGIAPGRINLIGEHTDYNDGFVFPAAIDRGMTIAASRADAESLVVSRQLGKGESFGVQQLRPEQTESWSIYPAGMAWAMQQQGHPVSNLTAAIDSDIPIGSGVSSSAAIEMAFGVVWNAMHKLGISPENLAKLGQVCENQFVGVNSGIMDQMASAMGKAGHAMFLDTRSLEIRYAPVPATMAVVLLDTLKPRALTDSAYNERRSQCEEASKALGVPKLRDADLGRLEAGRSSMSEVAYRRARHVITENERCIKFAEALSASGEQVIGQLMRASHVSLRDDYEVSCPELDAMAEAAWQAPGCVGARMTGAGFGGACVALVEQDQTDAFKASVLTAYDAKTGLGGEAMVCRLADGARIL